MTLQEKFTLIFNSGNWFIFENTIKRYNGEWVDRITWEHVGQPGNRHIKSCEWFGFETIEECVDDCINYIGTLEKIEEEPKIQNDDTDIKYFRK